MYEIFGINVIVLGAAAFAFLTMIATIAIVATHRKGKKKATNKSQVDMARERAAEEAIVLSIKAFDAILWARAADRRAGEGRSRKIGEKSEDVPVKEKRNIIYAAVERMNQKKEIFDGLEIVRQKFVILFGERAVEPLNAMIETKNLVVKSCEDLIRLDIETRGNPKKEMLKRMMLEVPAGLRLGEGNIDPVRQKLVEAIQALQRICLISGAVDKSRLKRLVPPEHRALISPAR